MKKIFLLGLASILWAFTAQAGMVIGSGAGGGTPQSAAYFGQQDVENASGFDVNSHITVANKAITFTCPGTGTRTVDKIGAYLKSGGGTPGHMNGALYSSDGNTKICEGAIEVTVSSTTVSWVEASPASCSCTGGTNYMIAVSVDSADVNFDMKSFQTSGNFEITFTDYTGGFPASFAVNDDSHAWFIRAHVTAIP